MGKRLGDAADPLLVSVRSGAAVLDAGDDGHRPQPRVSTTSSVGGLAKQTDNERFAYDSYRRFVQMFGKIVLDIDGEQFEQALEELREAAGRRHRPRALGRGSRRVWSSRFKAIVLRGDGHRVPAGPARSSSRHAIEAVFRSWNGERAPRSTAAWRRSPTTSAPRSTCRRWCSATRATTPAPASRSPATRPPARTGPTATSSTNAQGEDVVAGIRVTEPLDAMGNEFPESPPAAARA